MLAVIFWVMVGLIALLAINVTIDMIRMAFLVKTAKKVLSPDTVLWETEKLITIKFNEEPGWVLDTSSRTISRTCQPILDKVNFNEPVDFQMIVFKAGHFNDIAAFLMSYNLGWLCGLRRLSLEEAWAGVKLTDISTHPFNLTYVLGHKPKVFNVNNQPQIGWLYVSSKARKIEYCERAHPKWAVALAVR